MKIPVSQGFFGKEHLIRSLSKKLHHATYSLVGVILLFLCFDAGAAPDDFIGRGTDGAFSSTGASTFDAAYNGTTGMGGAYASVAALVTGGATTAITVAGGQEAGFSACDVAILINMVTGTYERVIVQSTAANTINLYSAPASTYDPTSDGNGDGVNDAIQLIRAPQFTNVTINVGHELTTSAFDGNRGGVIWFYATGTVDISGTINVDAAGWSGGAGGGAAAGGAAGALGTGSGVAAGAGGAAGGGGGGREMARARG